MLKNAYYTKESAYAELETLPNIDINIKSGNSLLHRFDLKQNISQILQSTGISINEYRDSVAAYKNAHRKEDKRQLSEIISRIKSTLRTEIKNRDPRLLRLQRRKKELNNLQAQELFDNEWTPKQLKEKQTAIKKAIVEIKKLETAFEEIKSNKMYLGAFEWRIEFPEVLDNEGNFIGFDCVIGNPPYIQLQSMGADSVTLARMGYQSYERTGDIYCLFYELGVNLLKPNYLLSFITSNKWMRAGYGTSMRHYFVEHTNPIQLIDFAGTRIFDSAAVDVNILTLLKQTNKFETDSCSVGNNGFSIDKLSDYFSQNSSVCSFRNAESWVVLTPIELSIKQKIEAIGTPLKDWDVQINYGIKTGFNDAFIIDGKKRAELITADPKSAEIIRPILRGRDIKRYHYDFADLWLINTHNGVKDKGVSRINIDDYPAIKMHLDQYWDDIVSRADIGDTPYNLRNCAYMDDFNKQKIVWIELTNHPNFAIDEEGYVINNTVFFMTGENLKYILAFLNSKICEWYFDKICATSGVGTRRWIKMYIDQIHIPHCNSSVSSDISYLIDNKSSIQDYDSRINLLFARMFNLDEDEIRWIEKCEL